MFWLVAEILIALALAVVIVAWTMSGRRRSETGTAHQPDDSKRSADDPARRP
ncbi:MAG: hypothetical protein U1F49_03800 [Rubrivivax sp.]